MAYRVAMIRTLGTEQGKGSVSARCPAGPLYGERHRGVVPLDELYRLYVDAGR
jgi:hypothetical protein